MKTINEKTKQILNRTTRIVGSFSLTTVAGAGLLLLSGCNGDLQVTNKDISTNDSNEIVIMLTFNKAVDPASVIPGTSIILSGANNPNAPGTVRWTPPPAKPVKGGQSPPAPNPVIQYTTLWFVSKASWSQIAGPGGTDTGVNLTLKSTVKAKDGSTIEQCKTGKPGTEQPGDCALNFVIPG